MRALSIGGTHNHAHVLLSLPSTMTVAKALKSVKGASSKWIKDNFKKCGSFAWQQGYGAFSVHVSFLEKTIRYIERQQEHHKNKSFVQEYTEILEKHGLQIDEKHTWD
jgi:REP element-mobilizing transposase RayT